MGFFSRLFKIGEAKANKVLDELEKPELMLEQAIRDREKRIQELKKAVQDCVATERQNKALLEQERINQKEWETKAKDALTANKEDLAIKALERAKEHELRIQPLEQQWKGERDQIETLKKDLLQLESELQEYKRNKDFIIAQSKSSEVRKQIYETKAKINTEDDSEALMERMKQKAQRSAHEAEAAKEMAETFNGEDSLEKEFADLKRTTSSQDVENKLKALKAELGTPNVQ